MLQTRTMRRLRKCGLFNPNTWVAYILNGEAFVKQARADAARAYPDFGCSFDIA